MATRLRLFYAAGPGNIIGTYRHWKNGQDDPSQVVLTYSGQFYDVCRELDARAYVIATCPIPGHIVDGNFRIRQLTQPTSISSSGRKCFDTTNPMIRIGVARNAPIGPHSHVQNARAKKTIKGLRRRLRPTMFGVTK